MSYIRAGHKLYDFEGESTLYVFCSSGTKEYPSYIEDYNESYEDNASYAQLIINIMRKEIKDESYIQKQIDVLCKKLNVKRCKKIEEKK